MNDSVGYSSLAISCLRMLSENDREAAYSQNAQDLWAAGFLAHLDDVLFDPQWPLEKQNGWKTAESA